jgi:hypothetical protein
LDDILLKRRKPMSENNYILGAIAGDGDHRHHKKVVGYVPLAAQAPPPPSQKKI